MYVRSYGTNPRDSGRDNGASVPPPEQTVNGEQATDTSSDAIIPETADKPTESEPLPTFGANGMPRQPLRRRKRPQKPSECGRSPQNEASIAPCTEDKGEPIAPLIAPCENTAEVPAPCENKEECKTVGHQEHRTDCEPRKPFGRFSTEDLLLGGLMILLINDHASDDVLLILAFLLISGMHFEQ